ncbi:RHOMBOID-like protein 12, mitochondrial isoform X2 [Punica granatum]|uniref:RHOMBOID-like protein 12, mitochondrial isoform X2 n=1 Tax=Punica granatum TaxID=22663 RepID=A0A6P8EKZ6_PUNGR|nr:RHOMBOID-like protein 12, mitochondrial isoform X2 [Punica granatum]
MQRLFSVKLLSNPNRLIRSSSSSSSCSSSSSSLLLRPARRPSGSAFSSSLAGPTESQLGKLANSNQAHGFLSNPLALARRNLKFSAWLPPVEGGLRRFRFFDRNSGFGSSFRYYAYSWRSWLRRLSVDSVVLGLIIANVSVFLLWQVADHRFMFRNFMISLDHIRNGYLHTMVTSAFSHMSAGHLVSNMLGLYFFGQHLGRVFGPDVLLKLYFAGAISGSIFYLAYHAFLALQSKNRGTVAVDPSRIPGLGIYIIGKDMLRVIEGDTEVSGSAHLGGAAAAAIAWARVRRGRF